ncbi:hypothetical protein NA57DRAFT_34920 [Rhizodiscina lignyota]|uniref:Transcriptional coactivator HFI1/ADA1 n=1 Tax=Rhizodiscina lignyota TaxID=1504668 RepID=A0A9P4M8S9_9PEZI|nr:hypothetical protein NA57DRAFT_34920 [Rhizodiscina lignyota]
MTTVNTDLLTNRPTLTPTTVAKPLPTPTNGVPKATKNSAPAAPRIDLEPLYATLKEQVGDKWARYKEALCNFILGGRNQEELTRELEPILQNDPAKEHVHNQLVCALLTNATRDSPEPGVASWVSANDKPTAVSKPVSGDAAEQRLKTEVMQLPARDRHRLKGIQDEQWDPFSRGVLEYHAGKTVKPPEVGPASAGGFNKTNWDLEIRKRYAQPLFSESNEFPDTESIQLRMVPICYEMGVGGGATPGTAEFLNVATETFVKQILSDHYSRVRSDGENYIKTATYKKRLEKEEAMWLREEGGMVRNAAGLLPVEVEASEGRRPLGMSDLKLALNLGDSYVQSVPTVASHIMSGWDASGQDIEDEGDELDDGKQTAKVNGIQHPPAINGHTGGDEMEVDGVVDGWGWSGGGTEDREALGSVLDDILTTGS